jgi:membrane fusion protein, copper/silver efflux system
MVFLMRQNAPFLFPRPVPAFTLHTAVAISCVMMLLIAGCSRTSSPKDGTAGSTHTAKERYTCPMHPSVVSDRPGACPVCNMALVKQAEQKEMNADESAMLRSVSVSPSQRVMANVATAPVSRRAMARRITAAGVLDVAEPARATVTARFRGRIENVFVNVTGSRVKKGQPLLEIYSPDLVSAQREYLIALDALTAAQQSGDVDALDQRQQLVSAARDRLRIHYGIAPQQIAEIEAAKKVRSTSTLFSPITGIVLTKRIVQGQYVDEGSSLYDIADLSTLWAYIEVYETDLRSVKSGQAVEMTSAAYPGERFIGRVSFIDPVMNPESRTVRVRVDVPNASGRLKPQMYVDAAIAVASGEVLAVPANAVLQTGRRNVVWVETKENQFEQRDVALGTRADGWYEILSGVTEGDMVVITGGYLIDSESSLQMPQTQSSTELERGSGRKDPKEGSAEPSTDVTAPAENGKTKEIKITVDYAYIPDLIEVKKGEKVRLLFYRKEDSECTEEVVFKNFGIRKKLPAFKTTAVEFTPTKAGTFRFACGMDMVEGKLIVK